MGAAREVTEPRVLWKEGADLPVLLRVGGLAQVDLPKLDAVLDVLAPKVVGVLIGVVLHLPLQTGAPEGERTGEKKGGEGEGRRGKVREDNDAREGG